jgi:hypothetical protein
MSEHSVQLFDGPDSLSDTLAAFLADGWRRRDVLLVVARQRHWAHTLPKLAAATGCSADEAIGSGRLVVLDAATTLASCMVDGLPGPQKFERAISALVARLCETSDAGLTIYGEMVDVLAESGDLQAAEEVERLWNRLAQRVPFRLLCGYASAHFADEKMERHLHTICSLHGAATATEPDLLGAWLLNDRRPRYHTS